MANLYGITGGGCQTTTNRPVQPVSLAAAATDQTITLTWDETDAVGDMGQGQYSEGILLLGTVTTEEGTALVGDGTSFTDLNPGDYLFIEDEIAQIASIEGDEALTLVSPFSGVEEGVPCYASGEWLPLADVTMGVETYEHADLEPETAYFYRMRTHYKTKWSTWSEPVADITGAEA